jgi:hypothetical protein
MALGKQGNHQLLDHVFLPDDDALNLGDGVAEELRGGLISGLARRPSGGALLDGLAKRRTTHALSCYSSTSVVRTDTLNRPRSFAGHRAILADAGLKAMGVRKPHAVTDIRASCEIHSSAAGICFLLPA